MKFQLIAIVRKTIKNGEEKDVKPSRKLSPPPLLSINSRHYLNRLINL
jgi:hypothetical protein